ncbi:protein FAM210B, mitochondrial-like [Montipora capricornis]|uniref:protein FAM210B, mitochondrial-like n=1 Tax=Montipora capricornis TaxID=246305 RepID=UPI0035F128E5
MIAGCSFRFTMASLRRVTQQSRIFASPVRQQIPTLRFVTRSVMQSMYVLHNGRTLHTSITRNGESSHSGKTERQEGESKMTLKERLKYVVQEYGTTAIVFHVCISLTSLGLCYAAVKSGIDVQAALQKIGANPNVSESTVATEASTFVVAYACHKVFAPVRMFMTITCTPLIVRRLRIMGLIKHPVKQ